MGPLDWFKEILYDGEGIPLRERLKRFKKRKRIRALPQACKVCGLELVDGVCLKGHYARSER